MVSARLSISNGLVTKSYAPARIAATAVSMFAYAVITMTGMSSRRATSCLQSSTPLISAMLTSVMTRPKSSRSKRVSASCGAVTQVTSKSRRRSSLSNTVAHAAIVIDKENGNLGHCGPCRHSMASGTIRYPPRSMRGSASPAWRRVTGLARGDFVPGSTIEGRVCGRGRQGGALPGGPALESNL